MAFFLINPSALIHLFERQKEEMGEFQLTLGRVAMKSLENLYSNYRERRFKRDKDQNRAGNAFIIRIIIWMEQYNKKGVF